MKKLIVLTVFILSSFLGFTANASSQILDKIEEGKHYITLKTAPSPDKEVIAFFSFYCGGCYMMETDYHLPQYIQRNLPKNIGMKKYHIDTFGRLSPQLSQAWAIANVLGMTEPVSKALFNAIHKTNSLNSEADIKAIFAKLNVSEKKYDTMKTNFAVQAFLKQQQNAFNKLKPDAVPSFYVNDKYKVLTENLIISTKDATTRAHTKVINYLIEHDGK